MLITDPGQPDNPIVFMNDAFSKLTGYARHEILGRNCRFLQGPDTDPDDVARLREAIAARTPIELDLLNYKKDGSTFWNRVLVSPVFDTDGQLSYFFASQFDVTVERERLARLEQERVDLESEVARRDAELVASEARLRFALKAGQMGFWSLHLGSMRMIASEGCKENFGRPASEPFTYEELLAAVHPDDRARRDAAVDDAIATGRLLDVEYRLITPTGEERWVQIRGQASYSVDGSPLAMIGVSQDVTNRRRAEEHRALLAGELGHRVKNSFAMMQALISQTLRRASSLEEAGSVLQSRVLALAAANDLLISEGWSKADLRELLMRTLEPFGAGDGGPFDLTGADVDLPTRLATALGLGIHEMATNAVKYGALSVAGGRVKIDWTVDDDAVPPRLNLTWAETGGPPVSMPAKKGFGATLIERTLKSEAGGATRLTFAPGGVVLSLDAPLLTDGDIVV